MEDVLDLYEQEYDSRSPTVCFDEKLIAPQAHVRPPEPMEPGHPERVDDEYERLGTANLFFNALAALGLAACDYDGAAHQARLRPLHPVVGRFGVSTGGIRAHRTG